MKKVFRNLHAHALRSRFLHFRQAGGIQTRIFCYFLLFTALLLILLWLFQIVFLDSFYRFQKRETLRSASESIVRNIDNENLFTLIYRIAEQDNICILVTDEQMRDVIGVEAWNGCIIHHMARHDLQRMASALQKDKTIAVTDFPLMGFRNQQYDARKFMGRVPPSDNGRARSMLTVQCAEMQNGEKRYVFLNTLITPVSATVQTIRNELYLITFVLVALSFILSFVLSKRITRPLIETTVSAADLSRGEYTPVANMGYREIAQLNRQLEQAAHDLHRVEEMQQELIANISHDLRTPLTLIEGYAEMIRDLPDEATSENMQVIVDETKRLSTLVNAVLELGSVRGGEGLRCAPFDLTACIHQILERYQKLVEQDGYHILFAPDEHLWVDADEVRIQQVIYNLINNALTYTGEDRTICVIQKNRGDTVRIDVKDTGDGIAQEELAFIWDRYYRGKKPHKRARVGSGLGLSIVKEILEQHGAMYGVESGESGGTVFWFALKAYHE